jgi:hypothetical protein
MSAQRQLEREEEQLGKEYALGRISQREYNEAMRELHRDYAESARESASDAYERELDNW